MLSGKKVLAVVPARGGSKGIPLKNLREINGRTLVAIVGEIAAATSEIDRRVVSTDHEKIADAALAAGLDAPFRRPESIAGDRVSDWEVLVHALKTMEGLDQTTYDIVLMLQPTSPLRTVENVQGTLRMLVDGDYDSVWSVSMTDSKAHPLKQLTVVDGKMEYWDARGEAIIARQQLKAVYHRNGVAYAVTRQCLLEQKSIKGAKAGAYVVEGEHVSIDTEWDLNLVNWLLSKA
tara:strand:- start:2533 stop:3234 length:702 start_codon:yes stop_codon:yes gene_type:complete